MDGIARFEKVSFRQFQEDWNKVMNELPEDSLRRIYDNIKLPERKTIGSAGYDFCSPIGLHIAHNATVTIPTGICCEIKPGWVLKIYMRSGLGFKYGLRLVNGTGIIDSDYYSAENEGHIHIKLANDSPISGTLYAGGGGGGGIRNGAYGQEGGGGMGCEFGRVNIRAGDGIVQGVFIPFGLTVDDAAKGKRVGGFGSTDRQSKDKN